jgi:hypothetical protein
VRLEGQKETIEAKIEETGFGGSWVGRPDRNPDLVVLIGLKGLIGNC